jgi:N-acetylmuramoyl-L-alanine amidase
MYVTEIVIHHAAELDTPSLQWGAIRRWHMGTPPNGPKDGPYRNIGYHAGVELIGVDYEILLGRPWDQNGAHTLGHNQKALGLCLVGNFTLAPPPDAQLQKAAEITRYWMELFNVAKESVSRHKDLNDTDCPGLSFPWDQFRSLL